jgi:glutaredoxin
MKALFLFLVCLCWLGIGSTPGDSGAEMYKWTDEKGVLHFGDAPPLKGEAAIETLPTRPEERVFSPQEPQDRKQTSQRPPSRAKNPVICVDSEVELYTTSWCSYCQKAREFFNEHGVAFIEYDIETDQDAAQQKQELDGLPGVPFALVNGEPVHGFLPSAYEKALTQCSD